MKETRRQSGWKCVPCGWGTPCIVEDEKCPRCGLKLTKTYFGDEGVFSGGRPEWEKVRGSASTANKEEE